MIVKTGANYQAEGGYIEASANGFLYTLTDNDKILAFGGSEELGPFIVPVTIINETGRELTPTCMFTLAGITNIVGTRIVPLIGVGETATINCIGIIGLRMLMTYTGGATDLKCDSEYVTLENGGGFAAFSIAKMPENGEPITARLYI